ncbi:MAG: caspase family protein [Rhodobacteraceae bacterium]|nr:caspase family protein [Paracoccaceae bacterium]
MQIFRNVFAVVSACVLIFGLSAKAAQANRTALVIGNASYQHAGALKNPVNDARAMAAKLSALGFNVVEGYDLDYVGTLRSMRDFARASYGADVALVYYAGHGIAVDGQNYLVPTDARLDSPSDWKFQLYAVADLIEMLNQNADVALLFLDACRDNPLSNILAQSRGLATRSAADRGLSPIQAPTRGAGIAVAFATSPGQVASDGEGAHSPFAAALLTHIDLPNTDIMEVMSRVTGDVYKSTNEVQRPWFNASLTGTVVLNPREVDVTPQIASPKPAENDASIQQLMFQAAMQSNDIADFQAYLAVYPEGLFAPLARNAIARLDQNHTAKVEEQSSEDPQTSAQKPAEDVLERGSVDVAKLAIETDIQAPVSLGVEPNHEETESALNLRRSDRREIQIRLTLLGHKLGGADGLWGKKTRSAISAWQETSGHAPTGYVTRDQIAILEQDSETLYQSHLKKIAARNAAAQAAAARQAAEPADAPAAPLAQSNRSNNLGSSSGVSFGVLK